MIRPRFLWLLLALAGTVPVAGCGSADTTVTTIEGAQATTTAQATSTPTSSNTPAVTTTTAHTAQTTTTKTASTGAWNTAQCDAALSALYKGHPRASSKQLSSYKISLHRRHACFTPPKHVPAPTVPATAGTWSIRQCDTALLLWYRHHLRAGKQALRAYRVSLSAQHRCFPGALHP